MTIFRISFFTILLLTGCENKHVETPVVVGQIQQIESPLQNTADGMAKAKALEIKALEIKALESERSRFSDLPTANPRTGNPLF